MKVGVVGHGSIGSRHARNLAALGHEPVIYDPMGPRDVSFERNIYETCPAVVIATPSIYHVGGIRAAAERGCHMLVEKPIAMSDNGLRELLDLAASNGAVVMVGNNLRFHPCIQQARHWIDAGAIGQPLWAQFTSGALSVKPAYLSDGVLMITGSHEVDLALHLLGPVAAVMSASVNRTDYGDDIADFVLLHESGARSSFHLDFVTPNEIRESWIVGTEKNIGIDLLARRSSLGHYVSTHDGSYDDDYVEEMRAFIQRIEGGDVPGATGEDGLAVLKVLLAVRQKAGL